MPPIPMVPKLRGPPGLTQQSDTVQGPSVAVEVADDNKRTSVYKKKAAWGYGCASAGDADDEWSEKRRRGNEAKKITEVVTDMTLEQSIFAYIQKYQIFEHGEGLGITISDLNRNIDHPEKPKGHKSEQKLKERIRLMPSLQQAEALWKGEIVFKIRKQRTYSSPPRRIDFSPSGHCDEILKEVITNLQQRRNNCNPQETYIYFKRTHYEELISDLMEAREALRISDHES